MWWAMWLHNVFNEGRVDQFLTCFIIIIVRVSKRKPKDEVFDLDSPNLSRWLAMSNLCTHVLIYPLFKYDELTKRVVFMEDLYKSI